MAERTSICRNFSQLQRAPFIARYSPRARFGRRVPSVAAPSPNPVASPAKVQDPENTLRSAAIIASPAPRAQAQADVSTAKAEQCKVQTTSRKDVIRQLKSPDWLVSNPRGQSIPVELRNAMSSLIAVCRMLEKISVRLDSSAFANANEVQHVEAFSARLFRQWNALSLVLECYNDDPGWARSMVSRTTFEMEELFLDLRQLLEHAKKVLDFSKMSSKSDDITTPPFFWLERDAYDRYRTLEDDLIAVVKAMQQLDQEFRRLPGNSRAAAQPGNFLFVSSDSGAQRKPVPRTDKSFFPVKRLPEMTSLEKQTSLIHECLCDLTTRLASANLEQQLVASLLNEAATALQATMQSAKDWKAWELGLHRSRHLFLKARVKLQGIALDASSTQTGGLATAQKIAASIYASFDSVINIVLGLPSDGVTNDGGDGGRQKLLSRNVSIKSPRTKVTRRAIPANPDLPDNALHASVRLDTTPADDVRDERLITKPASHPPIASSIDQNTKVPARNAVRLDSPMPPSSQKASSAATRSQEMNVAWEALNAAARTSGARSNKSQET